MEKGRNLIWDELALIEFVKSLQWISENPIQRAEKFEHDILAKIDVIRIQPERSPPDKYKNNNEGNYRSFEILNYRISYLYTKKK